MPTPIGSTTAYATAAQLIDHYDSRRVGDLCLDTDARESEANIPTNAKVLRALKWASGKVEAAALASGRYTAVDLLALTGMSLEYLVGLTCDLAFWRLTKRRYPGAKASEVEGAEDALADLERLRQGEEIFALQEITDASNMDTIDMGTHSDGTDRRITSRFRRLFGSRAEDMNDAL